MLTALLMFLLGLSPVGDPPTVLPEEAPVVWEPLPDMPQALGRFAAAALDGRIYLVGGVYHNVRAGDHYGDAFRCFDPRAREWTGLPPCPVATGGAVVAADLEKKRLIVLGGLRYLGEPLPKDRLEIGIYDSAQCEWTKHCLEQKDLGRPVVAFVRNGLVYFLTGNPAKFAVLSLDPPALEVIGDLPIRDRGSGDERIPNGVTGLAPLKDCAVVCTERGEFWKWDYAGGPWKLAGKLQHLKPNLGHRLFTDGERPLLWVNEWSSAALDTAVYEIDLAQGKELLLHRALPGPPSRRSAGGAVCDGSFYLLGGQRADDEWLSDAWRYDIVEGRKWRDLEKFPDLKLDWAVDALRDARILETWVWETLQKRKQQVVLDRIAEQPDAPRLRTRWLLLQALHGEMAVDLRPLWETPAAALLAEAKDLWPLEIEPPAQDGAYHWTVRARSLGGPVAHDAIILSMDQSQPARPKLVHFEVVRERVYLFEQSPLYCGIYNCGVLNQGRICYSSADGRGYCGDSRGFGHQIPAGLKLPKINLKDCGAFSQNAIGLQEEVLPLVPAPYLKSVK